MRARSPLPSRRNYHATAFAVVMLSFASSPQALAQVLPAGQAAGTAMKLVPIVLDVAGIGSSRYTTELTLANRGTTAASVTMTYTPATSLGATGSGAASTTLAAGRQLVVPDVIAYLRGLGLAIPSGSSQGGTLLVAFSGLSSADAGYAAARTTTPSGAGRAGLSYPGVDLQAAQSGTSYAYGLRSTAGDRTNLAFSNAGAAPVTLRVTLTSGAAGDDRSFVLSPDTTLQAGQWLQVGKVLDLAGYTNGYARIDIVSGTGPYVAYAVFNDNTTNDGSYVAVEPALLPAEARVLPVLVESAAYESELVLTNPLNVAQTATLTYVESASPAGGSGGTATLSFQPGEQKIVAGAIDFLRKQGIAIAPKGSATFAGALSVTFKNGASVSSGFVGARAASQVNGTGPGEYGLFYAGVGPSFAASSEAWVYGLQQNGSNRSNLAVASLGDVGGALSFRVDVFDGDTGKLAGSTAPATLSPGGWAQLNAVLQPFNVSNGYAHVTRLSGSSRFAAYGVVNDGGTPGQGTSDGSFVAAQVVPAPIALTWIPGSSVKVEQVLGDCDWTDLAYGSTGTCRKPTASQTITKANVLGADLGYSFEDSGKVIFLFGDTIGVNVAYHAADSFAWSTSTDPAGPLALNVYAKSDGTPFFVTPPNVVMGADDVPASGISLPSGTYIVCSTGSDTSLPNPHVHDTSVLVRFDETARTFSTLRTISSVPGGRFINMALHESSADVYEFGLGDYRATNVYLATVPSSSFESGAGTRYFTGLVQGQPTWSSVEGDAVPIVVDNPLGHAPPDGPTIGNISVVYSADLGLWLMTYDGGRQSPATNGVYFSYAPAPWGPWSPPQLIFNAARDHGLGVFIHDPSASPAGPAGPTIDPAGNPPAATRGGTYAPFMIERFTRVAGGALQIDYTLSTWNPYTVVRMRSKFIVARAP